MSKINAVRFVNLNYNHNAISVSDEIMYLNGESTLIKLDNGGGKSVLVQMMTAPFVQKRYRNVKDRPFASYFTSPVPSFILVEWKLDRGAGYVMTGLMVRQNQNADEGNENEPEVISLISEYGHPCVQDLRNLPVVETVKDRKSVRSWSACKALFDSYKKDRSLRFFTFDLNNSAQARQYFERLTEYGINYREWQSIIRKINEEESGLSRLFEDCRDERGLTEKWFLYAIENKLNREQNRIYEFRNILEKYIRSYRDNQDKIRRRDTILQFEEEAAKIRERAEAYRDAVAGLSTQRTTIGAYIHELQRLSGMTSAELSREQEKIGELTETLLRTVHEELSSRYYEYTDRESEFEDRIPALSSQIEEKKTQEAGWERTLKLLEMAERQRQADSAGEDYQQAVQALEVCRSKSADLKPERDYIGYLLRRVYEQQLSELSDQTAGAEKEIEKKKKEKERAAEQGLRLEKSIRETAAEEGVLRAGVQAFDREENRYVSHWNASLNRNLMGRYEDGLLQEMAAALEQESSGLSDRLRAMRKAADEAAQSTRKLEATLAAQEEEARQTVLALRRAEEENARFDGELTYRRAVLRYLELKEDVLFDRDRILSAADSKISAIEAGVQRTLLDADRLREEIRGLTTGQMVELSPEVRELLDNLGIHTVYGFEWLKRNGNPEEKNLQLVAENPFLPYALIMSESELEKLQTAEANVYTSAPLPIITRESLSSGRAAAVTDAEALYGVHFYMLFNENLLNEERLNALLRQKNRELEKKTGESAEKQREYRDYIERRNRIADQTVTKTSLENVRKEIAETEARIEALKAESAKTKEELALLQKETEQLNADILENDRQSREIGRQRGELGELTEAYEQYLARRAELTKCREVLAETVAEKERVREQEEMLADEIRLAETERLLLLQKHSEKQRESDSFRFYQKTSAPQGFDRSLEADEAALRARYRAVTETVSHEEQELMAAVEKAAGRREELNRSLRQRARKYQLREEEWRQVTYSTAEEDHADRQRRRLADEIKILEQNRNGLEVEKGKAGEAAKQTVILIGRDCGAEGPLPREEVSVTDYGERKAALLIEKKKHEETERNLREKAAVYSSNLTALAEYEDVPPEAGISFEGHFDGYTEAEFRAFTGTLLKDYRRMEKEAASRREDLEKRILETMRMETFQEDYYRKPLETVYALTSDAPGVLRQLEVICRSYRDRIDKLMVDIAIVEEEKAHVTGVLMEYTAEIHAQMGMIDRNSSVPHRGKTLKMLKISLPSWEENAGIYKRRIEDLVDDITRKGMALLEKEGTAHEYVGKRMTTKELYDAVVGIGNVRISLYKIEAQREIQISWREVASNSGGEGFLSAFVILSALLYYMRRDETDIFADRNEGKVLVMDNPFAQTNASHLLKPMMEVAKKNNTQLVCFTGLGGESIYDRFDNIYVLNLVPSALGQIQRLKSTHLAGSGAETLSFAHVEVTDYEQMELLF